MAVLYNIPTQNSVQYTLDSGYSAGGSTFSLNQSVAGVVQAPGICVVDRVDSSGAATPTKRTYYSFTGVSSNQLTGVALADGTDQAHSVGAIVEFVPDVKWAQAIYDALSNLVDPSTLAIDTTKVVDVASNQTITGNKTFTGTVTGAGASTWTFFSGSYASGTTITVSGTDVTGVMKKGVVLKWTDSAGSTFKTGMVVSSAFSTNTTITIVGSTVASGDKSFYYGPFADVNTFIIPGTLATGTDMARSFYATDDVYPIAVDAFVKTAGTTNATTFDLKDDGTSIMAASTTISIASGGTSATTVAPNAPTTVIAKDSVITCDISGVSTTAPVEAYVKLYTYPKSLTSRS